MLFANSGHAILGTLNKNLPFDPVADFAGVSLVGEAPAIVVVPPSLGVSNLKEFVDAGEIEARHDQLRLRRHRHLDASGRRLFRARTGTDLVHIPYTVSATIIADLLGGRIQASFVPMAFVLPLLQDGRLRALAVARQGAGDRSDRDPDRAVPGRRLRIRDLVRHAGAGQDAEAGARRAQPGDRGGEQGSRAAGAKSAPRESSCAISGWTSSTPMSATTWRGSIRC